MNPGSVLSPAERERKLALYAGLSGTPGTGGPTSLALTHQSVAGSTPPGDRPTRCPNKLGWRWRNLSTDQTFAARCERNSCSWCLPMNVSDRAMAIGYANPQRFIRYSLVGNDWQTIRNRMKDLRYTIRKEGYAYEDCYHVEPNPAGTGHHVHAFQHGDYIPQRELVEMADSAGLGRNTDIRKWTAATERSTAYAMKSAAGYGMKSAGESYEAGATYLAANGKRLHHHSRGYFRHPWGEHIGAVRDAVKAARAARRTPDAGTWVLEIDPENLDG
jgi:hypothetical protein